ncbi:MAG: hypothetical protein KDG50_06910 [Chromatiales bacterium]|nr:hypothetical protein [Chromatiales bacterium]
MKKKLYRAIASRIAAQANCLERGNSEWHAKHGAVIAELIRDHSPSGSGFDAGTQLDNKSTPERLVFKTSFHHMNDGGYYDGWTEHSVIVTPSLVFGFNLRITGRDRNAIKDYIADCFNTALRKEVDA